ncbi:MAG: hypothetical protein B7C24_05285 [Bacteroidetes bacterium 4572_77]|nr:MAG: hypothetical protein B7C24_05285 [Bacteroidetes bacterium 4572_77]
MRKLSKSYQLLGWSILLVVIASIYISTNFKKHNSTTYLAKKMQTQIATNNVLLQDIIYDLQEILLISGQKAYENAALHYQSQYKDRFAFFLYQDHKLQLWTDNHIPISDTYQEFKKNRLQKIGNYYVLCNQASFQDFVLIGMQIIKISYPWENDYLQSHFAYHFHLPNVISFHLENGEAIVDQDNNTLFYLKEDPQESNKNTSKIGFLLFLFSFFIWAMILRITLEKINQKHPYFSYFLFALILYIWYQIHQLLNLPQALFKGSLFSSELYAHPYISSSLGQLVFMSLILFLSVIYLYTNNRLKRPNKTLIYLKSLGTFLSFYIILFLIRSLVFDSQINLNLYQLASLDSNSYLILWVTFIVQLSWFLAIYPFINHIRQQKNNKLHLFIIFATTQIIIISLYLFYRQDIFLILFLLAWFLVIVYYFQGRKKKKYYLSETIFYLLFFTLCTTSYINHLSTIKEENNRQTTLLTANMEKDPIFEAHFLSKTDSISKDLHLKPFLNSPEYEETSDSLLSYITNKYFNNYQQEYLINLIPCNKNSDITLLPANETSPCYNYFEQKKAQAHEIISPNKLYLIEGSFQYKHYLGIIELKTDSSLKTKIFIEFVSKRKIREMGLPALLEKAHQSQHRLTKGYSYAIYKNGLLNERYGSFDYKQKLKDYHLLSFHTQFFNLQKHKHYLFAKDQEENIIISSENPKLLERIASFTFIFLIFSMLTFLFYSILFPNALKESLNSFQGRLQYSMIILLLFSFVLIGLSSLYYIYYLNENKNESILLEKAHSVLIELEHKISHIEKFTPEDKAYAERLLIKFSEVFFTDITLYNEQGLLIASSRPEMFSASLLSKRMEAMAFHELNSLRNSYFVQEEKIGTQSYLSAYLPFQNRKNLSVAYLNLPYFAKQYELENEVSGFIVAFLNIYLFLLFITLLITIIISRYLSKPILLIKEKLQHLGLDHTNEKIDWKKDDEIGELVKEYNRMVDELSKSAQKLALSQRESAWREMAQQIAHEIKNPLTPMKLNVQYLEKAWDDGVDDYEVRMKRITRGLQEQIDALTNIANQFSSFASIEKLNMEKLHLPSIIKDVVSIFKSHTNISFKININPENIYYQGDKSQSIRIFNNLYKNAVQAIGNRADGEIITEIKLIDKDILIQIRDNGMGISEKEIPHIFEPRFTTKTSGMGLGLALVKKMTENIKGDVKVVSEKGKGSVFTLIIPSIK